MSDDELFDQEELQGFDGDVAIERFEVTLYSPGGDVYRARSNEFDREVEEFLDEHICYDVHEYIVGEHDYFLRGVRVLYEPEGDAE